MKKIYIAPIAGVTDYTFRGILEDFKPDLIFTEMVSVNALSVLNDKTISKILKLRDGNAVQIFGEDIKKIKESAKYIENLGVKHINLNCGCPMKKIVNCGYGAALVKEPEKIKKILSLTSFIYFQSAFPEYNCSLVLPCIVIWSQPISSAIFPI